MSNRDCTDIILLHFDRFWYHIIHRNILLLKFRIYVLQLAVQLILEIFLSGSFLISIQVKYFDIAIRKYSICLRTYVCSKIWSISTCSLIVVSKPQIVQPYGVNFTVHTVHKHQRAHKSNQFFLPDRKIWSSFSGNWLSGRWMSDLRTYVRKRVLEYLESRW